MHLEHFNRVVNQQLEAEKREKAAKKAAKLLAAPPAPPPGPPPGLPSLGEAAVQQVEQSSAFLAAIATRQAQQSLVAAPIPLVLQKEAMDEYRQSSGLQVHPVPPGGGDERVTQDDVVASLDAAGEDDNSSPTYSDVAENNEESQHGHSEDDTLDDLYTSTGSNPDGGNEGDEYDEQGYGWAAK